MSSSTGAPSFSSLPDKLIRRIIVHLLWEPTSTQHSHALLAATTNPLDVVGGFPSHLLQIGHVPYGHLLDSPGQSAPPGRRRHPTIDQYVSEQRACQAGLNALTRVSRRLRDLANPFLYRHLILCANPRRPHPTAFDYPSSLHRLAVDGLALITPTYPPPSTPLRHTLTLELVPPSAHDPQVTRELHLVLLNAPKLQRFAIRPSPDTLIPPFHRLVPNFAPRTFRCITKLVGVTVPEAFIPQFIDLLVTYGATLIQLDVSFALDRNAPQPRRPSRNVSPDNMEWTDRHTSVFAARPPPCLAGLRLLSLHIVQPAHYDSWPPAVLSRGGYSGSRALAFIEWVLRRPDNLTQLVHISLLSGPVGVYLPTITPNKPPPAKAFTAIARRCWRVLEEVHLGPLFAIGLDPAIIGALVSLTSVACSVASLDTFNLALRRVKTLGLWLDLPNPYLVSNGQIPLALRSPPGRKVFPNIKRIFWLGTSTGPEDTAPTATFPAGGFAWWVRAWEDVRGVEVIRTRFDVR